MSDPGWAGVRGYAEIDFPDAATMAGFDTITVKSTREGYVDLDDLRAKLDDQVAVFMITDPRTVPAGRTGRMLHGVAIGV